MLQRVFGNVNIWLENYFDSQGIKIFPWNLNHEFQQEDIFTISDYVIAHKGNLFEGLNFATDFRLAGNKNIIVVLSFLKKNQLNKFDHYKILNQPNVWVWQLPLDSSMIQLLKNGLEKHDNVSFDAYYKEYYPKRFGHLFEVTRHGKSFDLINKATGPIRATCMLALYTPEMEYKVWDKLEVLKERISIENSINQLFLITNPYSAGFLGGDNYLQLQFVILLNKLMESDKNNSSLDDLVKLIDNLHKAYYKLTEIYG